MDWNQRRGTGTIRRDQLDNLHISNSGIPSNVVTAIAFSGTITWIGTLNGGLAKFDGTTWTTYDPDNSGLPDMWVTAIAIDQSGILWIGTDNGGLAKLDGTNWTLYNTSNSDMPSDIVTSINIDNNGSNWIGTYDGGLAVFNENGVPASTMEKQQRKQFKSSFSNPATDYVSIHCHK